MSDIFQEVQEDLRAERAREFWRRWGVLFGVLAVLVAAAVGGWQAWRWHEARQADAASLAFAAAQRSVEGDTPAFAAAARRFAELAAGAPAGYRILARLRAAALLAEASARELQALLALRSGDRPGAERLLRALAEDEQAPEGIRSRARRIVAGLS